MEIPGKIALVTGSARRVGRAIALALAKGGADVAVHYSSSLADARQTAGEIGGLGRRAEVIQADLAEPSGIERLFEEIRQRFGRLDVLVNNAGVYHRTPIETLTAGQWDMEMAINARAPALCIGCSIPLMSSGGAIVNIADTCADRAWGGFPAYCASKAALLSLTVSTSKALAGRGIRVNAVSPGIAAWPEGTGEDDPQMQKVLSRVPMRRAGSPEDIANAVLFLVRNDYITGQNLRVDGGWNMR